MDFVSDINKMNDKKVKGKGFPYSLPSVGLGANPSVQAVSLQVSHPPGGRLPLLTYGQLKFQLLKIKNGRRSPSRKIAKMAISTQWFDRLSQNLTLWCTLVLRTLRIFKISNFNKSNMADDRHLKKSKNRHISEMAWPICAKYGILIHTIYSENRIGS